MIDDDIVWLQVISNPFDDIVPRVRKPKLTDVSAESKKLDKKGTKFVIFKYYLLFIYLIIGEQTLGKLISTITFYRSLIYKKEINRSYANY